MIQAGELKLANNDLQGHRDALQSEVQNLKDSHTAEVSRLESEITKLEIAIKDSKEKHAMEKGHLD